jgi:hypothetical protein
MLQPLSPNILFGRRRGSYQCSLQKYEIVQKSLNVIIFTRAQLHFSVFRSMVQACFQTPTRFAQHRTNRPKLLKSLGEGATKGQIEKSRSLATSRAAHARSDPLCHSNRIRAIQANAIRRPAGRLESRPLPPPSPSSSPSLAGV